MLSKSIFVFLFLLLLGCQDESRAIEITGRISIKGSSPHHYIALYDKTHHKVYKLIVPKGYDISIYQNKIVTLRVEEMYASKGIGFPEVVKVLGKAF